MYMCMYIINISLDFDHCTLLQISSHAVAFWFQFYRIGYGYELIVELIFFWSLGGQQIESFVQNLELWLIVSNSNAFVYLIVDHSVWKVLIKNAIDLDHRLYICRVSRIYCQFLRFFFMGGGGGRFKSKYWNHGSFDVSLCIQCSKDWQSGDIP